MSPTMIGPPPGIRGRWRALASVVTIPADARAVLAHWYVDELLDSTRVLQGSLFGWLFGLSGQHAVTINGTVHLTPKAPDVGSDSATVLIGHELFHVEHQRRIGWWRYLAAYVARWRPAHVRQGWKHPYQGWKHPYEAPAYARGREIRAALGG